ncbi:MAG: hypothetical protein ACLUGJ_09370 [Blautia wexlerae]
MAVKAEVSQQDDSAKDAKEAGSSEAKVETPVGDTAKEDTTKEDSAKENTTKKIQFPGQKRTHQRRESNRREIKGRNTRKRNEKEEAPESENTQKNETAQDADEQKQAEAAAQNADEKNAKDIAVQANEGEKDVASKTDLETALNDDSIHTINITGDITYTDSLATSKRIVVKNGSTFKWSVYKGTFSVPLEIESGATFIVSSSWQAIVSGDVTNNGTVNVTRSSWGICLWNAVTSGSGTLGSSTADVVYVRYGCVPDTMLTGSYRINVLDDQSKYPTVALPTTMYVGDTITPTFTNIIGGVDLASVLPSNGKDGNSFERYDKAVSPKLTKAGTLKLNVSVKKPYAMQTSGNSSPGSLDAQGTVTQKLLNIVYVDANNGDNNNLGDTTTSALKTVGKAIDHVAEGGTIILLSDCSSSAVIEKSVTIRSADGNKFTFNPSYIYVYKSVNFASVNFEGLTVSKAAGNIGNIAFNNCTGTISSIADSIANVTVENSAPAQQRMGY